VVLAGAERAVDMARKSGGGGGYLRLRPGLGGGREGTKEFQQYSSLQRISLRSHYASPI